MPAEKQTVNCPECDSSVDIYGESNGICSKCGLNVQAIHERARHERALKKVLNTPSPEPIKKPKNTDDPFSFKM